MRDTDESGGDFTGAIRDKLGKSRARGAAAASSQSSKRALVQSRTHRKGPSPATDE
ncbi:hypothetical protein D3C75_1384390 [compost metagenome]